VFYDLKRSQYNSGVKKDKHLNDTLYEESRKDKKIYKATLQISLHQYNSRVITKQQKNN